MRLITIEVINLFKCHLTEEEKSVATVKKYIHDVSAFSEWIVDAKITKTVVLDYKRHLAGKYTTASVNSIISSLNSFFDFIGRSDVKVKTTKVQKSVFTNKKKELTRAEYDRLLCAAEKYNFRLCLLMQCICSTGTRVSELKYITVEALHEGRTEINNKGKCRVVFLPGRLCKALKKYASKQKISSGPVFVSKNGNPLDRSNIWSSMKKLCKLAGVAASKVFPHNLRHLFARTYYNIQKDIVRLSDILGHSNINTTRIYTQESGEIHRQQIQKLGLLRC